MSEKILHVGAGVTTHGDLTVEGDVDVRENLTVGGTLNLFNAKDFKMSIRVEGDQLVFDTGYAVAFVDLKWQPKPVGKFF